jgi:hypothetical protein
VKRNLMSLGVWLSKQFSGVYSPWCEEPESPNLLE